ncbi:MAG: bifunctional folylpolyglutamate synthase/dihydrofolate synthase [Alphaproteobacteria bacterium]|nr:bifunctional folylpolyglutamate synthase/dihydrofolate synthase [Alphaproteobacteria bacterium]
MLSSQELFDAFAKAHGADMTLGLRPPYFELLEKLGNPHLHLPNPILVGGTNGKGSTCAFLRAILESAGKKVHVYTSPHLITLHERIRLAGKLIDEDELAALLTKCAALADSGVSPFEAFTAVAMTAFVEHKADYTILEIGLGGRLDAVNVVPHPLVSVISRISYDHMDYLGSTLDQIAREKAGIMRAQGLCVSAGGPDPLIRRTLRQEAQKCQADLRLADEDWSVEHQDDHHFIFHGRQRVITDIPLPALIGAHQIQNAGLALAAVEALPDMISDEAIKTGMKNVVWPGRLQMIDQGKLKACLPQATELWLDGGHNDSAGEALGAQLQDWFIHDQGPFDLVFGMLQSKDPVAFLTPLLPFLRSIRTIAIEGGPKSFPAQDLALCVSGLGFADVKAMPNLEAALCDLGQQGTAPKRVLVTGSLYLVGYALAGNQRV